MNRCIRCDTEHNLSERGLCPSCEFIVTAGLPTAAPVAPTSADVPKGEGRLSEIINTYENRGHDATAFMIKVQDYLDLLWVITDLRTANAALQARNAGLVETMQHIAVKVREVGLEEGMPEAHFKTLWDLGTDLIRIAQTPAPNGGETAAEPDANWALLDVEIGPDLGKRLAQAYDAAFLDQPLVTDQDLVDIGRKPERSGPFDHDPLGTGAPDTTPAPPAAPRKLSKGVKLTAAMQRVIDILTNKPEWAISEEGYTYELATGVCISWRDTGFGKYGLYPMTLDGLVDRGLIELYTPVRSTYLSSGKAWRLRAALAARESEAGK